MGLIDKLIEKKLTYKARKGLPSSAFVFPNERRYPIHDIAHGRNALARVSAHGTPAEQNKVRSAVYNKYPELAARKASREKLKLAADYNPTRNELREWIWDNIDLPKKDIDEMSARQAVSMSRIARRADLLRKLKGVKLIKGGIKKTTRVMA
jgi:hypothetical protein